jgi:DNA-binding NarL/FixJ family response regulator
MAYKVLIVDDNALIRRTVRSCLEAEPEWNVCGEAANGQIAVEKVEELHPDVVILDWQMPVMDGIEAARRITRVSPKTAIVMLTLHSGSSLRKMAQAVGIRDVLSKTDAVRVRLLSALEACVA